MGELLEEFERELESWKRTEADRPARQIQRLFLLALEREQIVTVGYREALIARRLLAMPIPADAREVARHALLWACKDEEMHAIYIRGVLLRLGGWRLRLTAYVQQAMGEIAGWSASVRQHVRFSQAPLSNALATLVALTGIVTGKVPRGARKGLEYGPFSQFCAFNVDAELTASRCWNRILELAGEVPKLEPELFGEFRRMKEDEDRHARIFQILSSALDEDDRLMDGQTADTLAGQIGAVGEFFLSPERRRATGNDVGRGGKVFVVRGQSAEEKLPMLEQLLEACGLLERLRNKARVLGKPLEEMRVAVKPTFMIGYHHKDLSPITDPALVTGLARRLRAFGVPDVAVLDSPTIYDRFYRNRSVREVARYFGMESAEFRIVDLSEDQVPHTYLRGMAQHSVSRTWKEADFRIGFAKMRSNPVDVATLTVATLEGIGPRHDHYFFAERQAHRDTAIMMILSDFPPDLALLDAYDSASDGPLGMMGNPHAKVPRRLYAGADPIAVDHVALRHMGVDDPDHSTPLRAARQWFGNPTHIEVVGVDEHIVGWKGPYSSEWATLLSLLAYPVYQFGSGRGTLFVPEMDEAAFPPITPPGLLLRLGRRAIQTCLGLRHPR
jgi:uncharacterized protein (DUF362 family)